MSNNNDAVLAFFIGAVAGAVTALLLAPQSGQETRQALRRGAGDLQNRGADLLGNAKDSVTRKAQEVSDSARVRVDAVKEAANEAKAAYRREMERNPE
jgi:gas vesicle protein